MSAPVKTGTVSPFAEPTRRVGGAWIALFATAWFGIWMAQLTPVQLLLPSQITEQLNSTNWLDNVVAFGIISAIAGACALVAYPLSGALSDRTTSRFGRRRPWILGGMITFAASLFLLGIQTSMVGIGVFWSLALIGFCVLTAAITATISDQVPVNQRGFVSGWVSAPQAVGTILGILLVTLLGLATFTGYALVAVLLVILVTPFLLWTKDAALTTVPEKLTLGALASGFWVSPRKYPDFGWTLLSRILVNLGNALGTTLLLYFLMFGLARPADTVEDDLLTLTAVYMVFFVASALGIGKISDRIGKRKIFVYIAAYLQALAALILAFVPDFTVAIAAAGLLGLGYGSFMAVDQALATQVLPDAHSRGKDLGVMNIATAVPQAVAPLLGAFIVVIFAGAASGGAADFYAATEVFAGAGEGFTALFIASAIAAALGGLAVMPIKRVK
ncbi:MFS transporter [Glaciihabitans arcticus]|uniref:MFS transporter n=1 Tax=Glaciihabitans arcticus TaxID=2668039 RepID=A0A4Q9GW36_9MICO|nr:MFS transporter [Glaciihabitans arcticus]TBN57417.1 MFS transporter [Glaciihabitans arcticus]